MVELPGGTFTMGSNDFDVDEKPPHQVTVSPFSTGRYEITQAQYRCLKTK
jgi:formylglycine-generating enzyme required for sulfatase activity